MTSRTRFDRAVRLTMTVTSIDELSVPIDVTVFTSTTDLRALIDAVGPWKEASEGLIDLKRGFTELVRKAQLDSEAVAHLPQTASDNEGEDT